MPVMTDYPPGSVSWLDVTVPNIDVGKAFYGGVFGWRIESPPDWGGYAVCEVDGGSVAGMRELGADETLPPSWSIFMAVADIDAAADALTSAGGTVVYPAMTTLGDERVLAARDVTGALIWFQQREPRSSMLFVDDDMTSCWYELHTPDPERSDAFYGSLFGYRMNQQGDGTDFDYALYGLPGAERDFGGRFGTAADPADPSHWWIYFAVPNPDELARRAAELGGTVAQAPEDTPYGRIGACRDPFGAIFGIIRPSPSSS